MIYAMSDLHGEYEKYLAMLKKINFSDDDELYIIGDVVDRGPNPVEILRDMSMRPNVFPIMGNHDKMAVDVLSWLLEEVNEQTLYKNVNEESMYRLMVWRMNGAQTTIDGFTALSREERADLLDYMKEFAPYEVVEAGGRTFILVHAGLGNFEKNKPLDDYTIRDLAFVRFDYDKEYFGGNVYIVTGHTPTLTITQKPEIYHSCRNICIDCGAVFTGGALACLRLDDMREYYV
jgi:Predicted phosphohydrolases